MARGGKREGSGRPKGALTRRTREIAENASAAGESPLEYMLRVMRDEASDASRRDEMAKAAASYCHPRLAAVEHSGGVTLSHEDMLNELDEGSREGDQASSKR